MQEISKNGKVYCVTQEPYPEEVVKTMKKSGYKVKEVNDKKDKKKDLDKDME